MTEALSFNMRLLAHHELQGFGGMGEGMGMQLAKDGRRDEPDRRASLGRTLEKNRRERAALEIRIAPHIVGATILPSPAADLHSVPAVMP